MFFQLPKYYRAFFLVSVLIFGLMGCKEYTSDYSKKTSSNDVCKCIEEYGVGKYGSGIDSFGVMLTKKDSISIMGAHLYECLNQVARPASDSEDAKVLRKAVLNKCK